MIRMQPLFSMIIKNQLCIGSLSNLIFLKSILNCFFALSEESGISVSRISSIISTASEWLTVYIAQDWGREVELTNVSLFSFTHLYHTDSQT